MARSSQRRLMLVAVATAVLMAIPSGVGAFTFFNDPDWSTPRHVVTFCVESTPDGVDVPTARALLNQAIAEWHTVPGQDTGQALQLSQDSSPPCGGGSVRIRDGGTTNEGAQFFPELSAIYFFGDEWWDGSGAQGDDVSYLGILIHEMGHTFGIHHAGDRFWTYDGNDVPVYIDKVGVYGGTSP